MTEVNFRSFVMDSSIKGFFVIRNPRIEWTSLYNYYSILRHAKIENSLIIMNEHDEDDLKFFFDQRHIKNSKNEKFLTTNYCWKINHVKNIWHFELEVRALKEEISFNQIFITGIMNFNLSEEPGNHFPIIYQNLLRVALELNIKIFLFQQFDDTTGTITYQKYIGNQSSLNSKMFDVRMGAKGLVLVEVESNSFD